MKTLSQLIASFEQKANQDDYAVVSREDLKAAAIALTSFQQMLTDTENSAKKVSLNSKKAVQAVSVDDFIVLLSNFQ